MRTIEYRFLDKSNWGDGPWQSEPDKRQWRDEATGLPCLVVRHPHHGYLCGYVGVPVGHPCFGVPWRELPGEVSGGHGTLNYAEFCEDGGGEQGICHVVEPGEPDRVWWIGFDCGHIWDIAPGLDAVERALMPRLAESRLRGSLPIAQYRTIDYVAERCAELAQSVAAIAAPTR